MKKLKKIWKRIICCHRFSNHKVDYSSFSFNPGSRKVEYRIDFKCSECGKTTWKFWAEHDMQDVPESSCNECEFYELFTDNFCNLYYNYTISDIPPKTAIPKWCVFNKEENKEKD